MWQTLDREQKVAAIQAVYEPGLSAAEIADRIGGVSRCAVQGVYKRNRARLERFPLLPPQRGMAVNSTRRQLRGGHVSQAKIAAKAVEFEHPVIPGALQTAGRPLMAMGSGQCRFPVNDAARGEPHLFCGAPSDGSWCEGHRARIYQQRAAR